jgi:NADH:ubiquinone oxidoreductase subunit K
MSNYLVISAILFGIGTFTVMSRRNAIGILLGIELLLNAVNINFIAFAFQHGNTVGLIFVLFTIAITVAEVALGLAIVILIFRLKKTVQADEVNLLKG